MSIQWPTTKDTVTALVQASAPILLMGALSAGIQAAATFLI